MEANEQIYHREELQTKAMMQESTVMIEYQRKMEEKNVKNIQSGGMHQKVLDNHDWSTHHSFTVRFFQFAKFTGGSGSEMKFTITTNSFQLDNITTTTFGTGCIFITIASIFRGLLGLLKERQRRWHGREVRRQDKSNIICLAYDYSRHLLDWRGALFSILEADPPLFIHR